MSLSFPAVVVCPATVVDNWVEELRTWAPGKAATAYRGPKRKELLGHRDVYVMSYDAARNDLADLLTLRPAAVVIDECHLIKNKESARYKAVSKLAAKASTVVALSGTPAGSDCALPDGLAVQGAMG